MRHLLVACVLAASVLVSLGCDDGGGGGGGGTGGGDPRPPQCKLERSGEECVACVANCCSACDEGTECYQWGACRNACGGDARCLADCDESHPEGETDWMGADMCVFIECDEVCAN